MKYWSTFPINSFLMERSTQAKFETKYSTFLMTWSLRIFFKCCSKIEHSRYTIVIVNFLRKYILWKMGKLDLI